MILVIGESNDITTNNVVEWLNHYKIDYKRVNFSDFTSLNYLRISNEFCSIKVEGIDAANIRAVWHRRGGFNFLPSKIRNNYKLQQYLKKEERSLLKSLEDLLGDKLDYIGSYHQEVENYKIDYLYIAQKLNIKIPETLITTSKSELLSFFNSYDEIITKDIRYPIHLKLDEFQVFSTGTFIVSKKMINLMNEEFTPVLVQEKIDKIYEIRVFFFKEKLFTMAILSQNDAKTTIDYRNYNKEKPNRNVPVLLPEKIKSKVKKFIINSKLSTGSIDLIVDKYNQYVFLEVNPQGQLDWVSQNCNYYIEKYIANYLAN